MDSATAAIVAFSFAIGFSVTEVLFWNRRRGLGYVIAMLVSIGLMLGFTRHVVQPVCPLHTHGSLFCIEPPGGDRMPRSSR